MDRETEQFKEALIESIRQMKRGEYARVHTPEQIAARRRSRLAATGETDRLHTTPEEPTG